MRTSIFLLLIFYCSISFAQHADPGKMTSITTFNTSSLTGGNDGFVYGNGINMNSPKYVDVIGSPFLNADFIPAFVAFKNGRKYKDVPVKLDMLHNEMDIQRDKDLISLLGLDSVSYPDFTYGNIIFKTSYPSVNGHDTSTIYQIVAQNNKIQLLKYYHCSISSVRSYGSDDKTSFDVDNQYYLFNKSTNTIKMIKLNKKSFSSAMSGMGYTKSLIENNKNTDFKNEKDVADLISSLNS